MLAASGTERFVAIVSNDPEGKGVGWALSCPTNSCGAISPSTTPSGLATTYTAPSVPPGTTLVVTITASSLTDSTKSASAAISLQNVQSLVINTRSLPVATANEPYSTTLESTGGTLPINWVLGVGTNLPSGLSIDSSGVISGTPSTPGSACFDVVAVDSSSVPQNAGQGLCIGVNEADTSHNSLLDGHYAFYISGFGEPGEFGLLSQIATAGSFVADGKGNITGGMFDTDTVGGVQQDQFTGTYALSADNRGTMSLVSSGGTITLAFAFGATSSPGPITKGRIISFASLSYTVTNGKPASGEFFLQDASAFSNSSINGSYAFLLKGWSAIQGQLSAAGILTADSQSNTLNGDADAYVAKVFYPSQPVGGSFSVDSASSNGRGSATLTIGATALNATIYTVSANRFLLVSADQAINPTVFTGQAFRQQGGPFDDSSIEGTKVFGIAELGRVQNVSVGLGAFDGKGGVTFSEGSETTNASYEISSSGRISIFHNGTSFFEYYLASPDRGFVLSPDGRTGFFETQTSALFTAASINGQFFFGDIPPSCCSSVKTGVLAVENGIISETYDADDPMNQVSALAYDQTIKDTYEISANGQGTTDSGGLIVVISPTRFVLVEGQEIEIVEK
jgi:hypothetical protein